MPRRWRTKYPCRRAGLVKIGKDQPLYTCTLRAAVRAGRSMPRPSALSRRPGWTPRREVGGCLFRYKVEFGASPAKFREVPSYGPESGVELHPHGHHPVACYNLGVPDPARLICVFIAVRVDYDIFAHDFAESRWARESLITVGRQHLLPDISEAKIVKAAAVEHRNCQRTIAPAGKLAFEYKIRRQLVDRAADLLGGHEKRPPRFSRSRGIGHGTVAAVIDPIMSFGPVSAHISPICFGASRTPGELPMDLGMTREVDKHTRKPSGVEVHRD